MRRVSASLPPQSHKPAAQPVQFFPLPWLYLSGWPGSRKRPPFHQSATQEWRLHLSLEVGWTIHQVYRFRLSRYSVCIVVRSALQSPVKPRAMGFGGASWCHELVICLACSERPFRKCERAKHSSHCTGPFKVAQLNPDIRFPRGYLDLREIVLEKTRVPACPAECFPILPILP
jgi:hypothetical protein